MIEVGREAPAGSGDHYGQDAWESQPGMSRRSWHGWLGVAQCGRHQSALIGTAVFYGGEERGMVAESITCSIPPVLQLALVRRRAVARPDLHGGHKRIIAYPPRSSF